MATAATISARLTLDSSEYDTKLKNAKKETAGFGKTLQKVGGFAAGAGAALTAGVTAPLVALGAAAVNSASDLEESANAVNVVFKDASDTILAYGENSAQTVGLATSEFNQLAAQGGALLQNLGFDQQAAADETINLTERAADLASIFNTDVSTALEAIQSGLKGEFNPLEQFGVKLNAAAIEAQALAMGLEDQDGAISDAAKAQAALALFYEQTDAVAGDFLNTSDGLANSQRILKAEMENLSAEFGAVLLPLVEQGVAFIRELAARFTALTPEQKKVVVMVLAMVAAIGPLLVIIGGLISAVGTIAGVLSGPLILAIGVVVAAVALLAAAWKNNWGGIREKTAAFIAKIVQVFGVVRAWLAEKIPLAIAALVAFWNDKLMPAFAKGWAMLRDGLLPVLIAIGKFVGTVLVVNFKVVAGAVTKFLIPALKFLWEILRDDVFPFFVKVAEWVSDKMAPAFKWLADTIGALTGGLIDLASAFLGIDVPDWLKPGSPTPFEMGLKGIHGQIKKMTATSLPGLSMGLQVDPNNGQVGGGGNQISLGGIAVTIQGNADEAAVRSGVSLGIQDALRATGAA